MSADKHHSRLAQIENLEQALQNMLLPDAALNRITQALGTILKARQISIYAQYAEPDKNDDVELLAQYTDGDDLAHPHLNSPTPALHTIVLTFNGETVGKVVLNLGDAQLLAEEQSRLLVICQQASHAVYSTKQMSELRRERERLILAREEERRRLRRNLHDSVGPTLAALILRSGAIRRMILVQPDAAEVQMGELREQIRSVITDIRRVIYDLRPPALDELGLLSAIREQARQMSLDGLEIEVIASENLPPLTAAAEVNTYFIICEALTNALRHSQARKCWVKIEVTEYDLVLEVCDDGVGLKPGSKTGVGLNSMRERATELGGEFEIKPAQKQGLCLRASLPLRLALRNFDAATPSKRGIP